MAELKYQAVPEKTVFIDLPGTNDLKAKAVLRGKWSQPLIIFVHGRPGEGNNLLGYLGARYFYEHGFSSLRIWLYDFGPKTRNLVDCILQTHADDFDTTVSYARKQGAKIVLAVGHSYGGLTILKSQSRLDGVVLWDPSHGLVFQEQLVNVKLQAEYPEKTVKELNINVGLGGYGYIEPLTMIQEDRELGDNSNWAAHKSYPLKVIAAGAGILSKHIKGYVDAADKPKEFVEIPGAGHLFEDSDEITFKVFEETANWFKEIIDGKL